MSGKTSRVDVLEHNIIMMAELPKQVYRFSAVLIKIQDWLLLVFFSPKIDKQILTFIWRCMGPRIAKTI